MKSCRLWAPPAELYLEHRTLVGVDGIAFLEGTL
jgi:hypothetical protein